HDAESARTAVAITDDAKCVPVIAPPREQGVTFRCRLVVDDPVHLRFIVWCGGLDGKRMRTAREESLSKDRVLDQEQQVGRVTPRLRAMRETQPVLKVCPCGPAVLAMGIRIPRRETAGD